MDDFLFSFWDKNREEVIANLTQNCLLMSDWYRLIQFILIVVNPSLQGRDVLIIVVRSGRRVIQKSYAKRYMTLILDSKLFLTFAHWSLRLCPRQNTKCDSKTRLNFLLYRVTWWKDREYQYLTSSWRKLFSMGMKPTSWIWWRRIWNLNRLNILVYAK